MSITAKNKLDDWYTSDNVFYEPKIFQVVFLKEYFTHFVFMIDVINDSGEAKR